MSSEAGIRADRVNASFATCRMRSRFALRVGARFSWGHFLILGRHKNKLQPETVSGYHMY